MKINKLCAALGLSLIFSGAFAQNNQVISEELFSELKEKGVVINRLISDEKSMEFKITPDKELCRKSTEAWNREEKPVFNSENLYLVSKAQLLENSSDKEHADISMNGVSKMIRSVSKMKGMKYYSNSKKKYMTLYHHANMIEGLNSKKVIADLTDGPLDGLNCYCILDDNTFGECVYKLEYKERPGEISVCFSNMEPLKLAMVSGVKKENLKITLTVVDYDEYFLVYMVTQAKYPLIGFLEKTLQNSFDARVDAIYKWVTYQF